MYTTTPLKPISALRKVVRHQDVNSSRIGTEGTTGVGNGWRHGGRGGEGVPIGRSEVGNGLNLVSIILMHVDSIITTRLEVSLSMEGGMGLEGHIFRIRSLQRNLSLLRRLKDDLNIMGYYISLNQKLERRQQ